ncbi:MAG TPA: MlaD family protein [Leptospiraceae bacterium]|nr:MlaD family protein [Leptospiraceae bacterium]HMZ59186.1 MlaD family protein [Leptospiraceae bacterium]HNF14010.1 MlaD family protein [Leptospiraceae bacterium]HNF27216.1 MlaD family protein [Leptospiraceae bacterium]HNH07921.1 MlaD family protein [Leptospiraceae bacterium]
MKAVQTILVGVLFLIASAVVGYFTIITEGGPLKKELHTMKIYFPNSEGIKVGSKVTVQGVPFGYISRVSLAYFDAKGNLLESAQEGAETQVEVLIVLQSPVKLYDNYEIKIRNESLLSGRIIAINPGFAKEDGVNVPAKRIHTVIDPAAVKPGKIKGKTSEDPLVSLSELIAENRPDIRKTVSNIADITTKINSGKGTIGKLINNEDMHSNVNTTLTDAQIVLRELREGLEDVREQAPVTSFIRAALTAF